MELYFNDKTYKLNQTMLYESLNENDSQNNKSNNQIAIDIIKQNKNNNNFINGLIDIIGGESNMENNENTSINIIDNSQIENLNTLQKSIESFKFE